MTWSGRRGSRHFESIIRYHEGRSQKVKQTIAELVSRDNTDFTAKEKALIQFARKANREPLRIPAEEFGALRGTGTTDAEILR